MVVSILFCYFSLTKLIQALLIRQRAPVPTTSTAGIWTKNRSANRCVRSSHKAATTTSTSSWCRCSPRCVKCYAPETRTAPECWRSSRTSSSPTRGYSSGKHKARPWQTSVDSSGINSVNDRCSSRQQKQLRRQFFFFILYKYFSFLPLSSSFRFIYFLLTNLKLCIFKNVNVVILCLLLTRSLGALWVCVVLNPHCSPGDKLHWRQMLERWSQVDVCPPEDPDFRYMLEKKREKKNDPCTLWLIPSNLTSNSSSSLYLKGHKRLLVRRVIAYDPGGLLRMMIRPVRIARMTMKPHLGMDLLMPSGAPAKS